MADLVYRQPCQHGELSWHYTGEWQNPRTIHAQLEKCPGGSEIVLDPDKVLHIYDREFGELACELTVSDVLAALEGDTE